MITHSDKFVRLKDGRQVAYTEHGDLNGKPVFFIHGNPGCRLQRHPDERIPEKLGARIITPDRPGYGLSDFQKGRTLLDFPNDIEQLADALNIDKFAVFGVSAGGPYVAACTFKLAERITNVAIVSGPRQLTDKDALSGMSPIWQKAFKLARLPKWILGLVYKAQAKLFIKKPDVAIEQFKKIVSAKDRELLMQENFRKGIIERRLESSRQGVKGMVQEAKILISPWGFDLKNINKKVQLWYWEDDPAIPIQMGHFLKENIPNTEAHFYKGGGHLSVFEYWEEIISNLVSN